MTLDPTVNIGNVLAALTLLFGFIVAHVQNQKRLTKIEERLDLLYRWFTHNVIMGGDNTGHYPNIK